MIHLFYVMPSAKLRQRTQQNILILNTCFCRQRAGRYGVADPDHIFPLHIWFYSLKMVCVCLFFVRLFFESAKGTGGLSNFEWDCLRELGGGGYVYLLWLPSWFSSDAGPIGEIHKSFYLWMHVQLERPCRLWFLKSQGVCRWELGRDGLAMGANLCKEILQKT